MNHLSNQTSPYLLQHKDNPVDWYAWSDEALAAAKEEDKPILLSVGYSTCHWCHVMAHESFEDEATAEIMNRHFINIKVDREERPDIDAIYMQAVTSLTGHGGWPMTCFLTPEGEPFYVGTYFPKERKQNMASFKEVLEAVAKSWTEERSDVTARAEQITQALKAAQNLGPDSKKTLEKSSLPTDDFPDAAEQTRAERIGALTSLRHAQDPAWGGFGGAPKFPQSMVLEFLLFHSVDDDTATICKTSLDAMASGGIYDHLGGGFARYATDIFWLVPHFEKMLYDNALLIRLYTLAHLITGKPRYRQVAKECIEYALRDLYDSDVGAFYSAEDADSENGNAGSGTENQKTKSEGAFYVWSLEEFEKALPESSIELAKNWYGVSQKGNFEGKNILYRRHRGDLARPPEIEDARKKLFSERAKRIRPERDEKILTEWNGLMIRALCDAHFYLGEADWAVYGEKACKFLYENLRRQDGRWLRSWTRQEPNQGERQDNASRLTSSLACAGDYAQAVQAFISFYGISGRAVWLERATETADGMLDLFWDEAEGGFFTTGSDITDVIFRPKDITDTSIPSANSAAALALMQLGALTGNDLHSDRANKILDATALIAYRNPLAFGNLLSALLIRELGIIQIVIPDDNEGTLAEPYLNELKKCFLPNAVLAWGEPLQSLIWEGKKPGSAYICRNFTCKEPADSPEEFASQLDELASQNSLYLKTGISPESD